MTYEEFYLHYHRLVFKRILQLTGDHQTTEDLSQTAWLKIWRAWPLKHEEHVTAFLWRVASNVAYDWHKRNRQPLCDLDGLPEMESQDVDPDVCVADSFTHDQVFWQCWARLHERDRATLRAILAGDEGTERKSIYAARRNILGLYRRATAKAERGEAVAR